MPTIRQNAVPAVSATLAAKVVVRRQNTPSRNTAVMGGAMNPNTDWNTLKRLRPLMLSFLLFVILAVMMVLVSIADKNGQRNEIPQPLHVRRSRFVIALWACLALVMVGLYVFFN